MVSSMPFNTTNATIPITSPPYNLTNGTFCVTSLMTEISTYLGANLTVPYLVNITTNQTALTLAESIPPTMACNDCIFATLDLVEQSFPILANLTISANYSLSFNSSNGPNVNSLIDGFCAAKNLTITTNGTLPNTIFVDAYNSTYMYNVTAGNKTFFEYDTNFTRRDVRSFDAAAPKRRWIGKW